jgi:hypothetical protein
MDKGERSIVAAPTIVAKATLIRTVFMMHLLPKSDQQRQFHANTVGTPNQKAGLHY